MLLQQFASLTSCQKKVYINDKSEQSCKINCWSLCKASKLRRLLSKSSSQSLHKFWRSWPDYSQAYAPFNSKSVKLKIMIIYSMSQTEMSSNWTDAKMKELLSPIVRISRQITGTVIIFPAQLYKDQWHHRVFQKKSLKSIACVIADVVNLQLLGFMWEKQAAGSYRMHEDGSVATVVLVLIDWTLWSAAC